MKITTVKRYSCDFCRKKTYASWAMRHHEAHCTLNPLRECKMCAVNGEASLKAEELARLVALVPDIKTFTEKFAVADTIGESIDAQKAHNALRAVWDDLVESTSNCPACIMAILRQAHFPLSMVSWWTYTDACKQFWDDVNRESLKRERIM